MIQNHIASEDFHSLSARSRGPAPPVRDPNLKPCDTGRKCGSRHRYGGSAVGDRGRAAPVPHTQGTIRHFDRGIAQSRIRIRLALHPTRPAGRFRLLLGSHAGLQILHARLHIEGRISCRRAAALGRARRTELAAATERTRINRTDFIECGLIVSRSGLAGRIERYHPGPIHNRYFASCSNRLVNMDSADSLGGGRNTGVRYRVCVASARRVSPVPQRTNPLFSTEEARREPTDGIGNAVRPGTVAGLPPLYVETGLVHNVFRPIGRRSIA